ncbi:MAG: hypothetical protein ACE5R4_18120 [Armatimonadota bacterium]
MAGLGSEAIDGALPETLAAIINGVIQAENLRDRSAVDNTLRLLEGLRELGGGASPEALAEKVAEVGVPRFYQTALLRVIVQMAISARKTNEMGVGLGVKVAVATIDARYAAKYSAATSAASTVEVEMVPTDAPEYLRPVIELLQAQLPPPPPQPPLPE